MIFRLLPDGFTNRDLRAHLRPAAGLRPEHITAGQMTYDLRRLRAHGLIERIPHTHRYQVTDTGFRQRSSSPAYTSDFLIPGIAQVTSKSPPVNTKLRAASRAYETAIDELAHHTGVAA